MVLGLHDYVNKNRFPGVVLGLSGGIDSALSAAVAVDALGPDRVRCVMMPSRYTSQDSLEDASEVAQAARRAARHRSRSSRRCAAFAEVLRRLFAGKKPDTTEENIQSRIRGVILMAISNKFGPMVLTTGNKSEMSVGYATLYGDMCGGYNVLKDLYKTQVFALSRWRNQSLAEGRARSRRAASCPSASSTSRRPPSCARTRRTRIRCRPMRCSTASSNAWSRARWRFEEIVAKGYDPATVKRVEQLLYVAEYKRRQAPPGVKISARNFGRDRRYPITNAFRDAR